MHQNTYTTGAELQTMREALHMGRDELATLCGVQARTIKHWENGRAGVPADVADLAHELERVAHIASQHAAQQVQRLAAKHGRAPDDLVLIRYRTAADLARFRPDMQHLPPGIHAAIVARTAAQARAQGITARIVWMNADEFDAWRSASQPPRPDTEAARSEWAAVAALQQQATPHRADQPPAD